MKISIGSDHGGYELKEALKVRLEKDGYEIVDRGTNSLESVDYPDFAVAVAQDVANKEVDYGVLMCTTGIGISISANKVKGIRAAVVYNEDGAEYARRHNDANIICFGGKYQTPYLAEKFVKIFTNTAFDGERHERRVNKIIAEENSKD